MKFPICAESELPAAGDTVPLQPMLEQCDTANSALQPQTVAYQTNFQTDCRAEFVISGQVDWQPGACTLQPQSALHKDLQGNWQATWQFELACEPIARTNRLSLPLP